jgi:hypothetical protein
MDEMSGKNNFRSMKAVELTVPPKDIFYISWNLDACEGLGFLETNDAKAGRVTIYAPAGSIEYIYSFIEGVRAEGVDVAVNKVWELEKQ